MRLTHGDLPVYSHDAEPVQPEDALLKALSCPPPLLAHQPPTMVTENYCFVIDANAVSFNQLLNEEMWRPTSSPVRYYFSEDLKSFQRVNIVLVRGKVISAVLRTKRTDGKKKRSRIDHKPVPLDKVFRVSRHFSHWRTCSKFHKIVSKVSPIQETAPDPSTWGSEAADEMPRRIFVQYLWREAKESEKLRVALEYDASLRRTAAVLSLPIPDAILSGRGRRKTLAAILSTSAMKRSSSSRSSDPFAQPGTSSGLSPSPASSNPSAPSSPSPPSPTPSTSSRAPLL